MKKFVPLILLTLVSFNCQKNMSNDGPVNLLATISTSTLTAITSTSATSGGTISADGGSAVTARGICWGTASNPLISGNHTNDGTGPGAFTSALTGLTATTTYYVRAYATNNDGTAYGNEISFTTTAAVPVLPTITTTAASLIFSTTSTSGGNITSDGGNAIIARGVCWSTIPNPVATGNHTADGNSPGIFTSSITGLSPVTTYYVRAYAINSVGVAYGNEISFTTPTPDVFVGGSSYINGKFVATIWKNGVAVQIGTGITESYIFSVFVSGNDVYAAGYEKNGTGQYVSKVWKNGTGTSLLPITNNTNIAEATSVFVQGTDVHVVGHRDARSIATHWKNAAGTDIPVSLFGTAYSVYASGNDVYIAGNRVVLPGTPYVATVWKNGVPATLPGVTTSSLAASVVVSGSDVYVAGTVYENGKDIAKLWKNNTINYLSFSESAARSVFVSGNDVYVAGFENNGTKDIAMLWKNGVGTPLSNSPFRCDAASVYVHAGDVYVTGYEVANVTTAKIWKNGVETTLSNGINHASGRSIFVR